jgi:preprotein translocase subunit SecG
LFKFDDKSFERILKDETLSKDLFREMGGTLTVAQLTSDLIAKSTTYLAPLFLGICVGLYMYFKEKKEKRSV